MMKLTRLMRFSSKCGFLIAVICLALMVVALGAAAKHSQFENASHSTHYLKQSVKMVSSNHQPAVIVPPNGIQTILAPLGLPPILTQPALVLVVVPILLPLLI